MQHQVQSGAHPLRAGGGAPGRGGAGQEIGEVLALGGIELKGAGQGLQDLGGGVLRPALFQPGVVLGAHPGQAGRLITAQTGHPADPAVGGQPRLVGGDPGPAGAQEIGELATTVIHPSSVTGEGGPHGTPGGTASTCLADTCLLRAFYGAP